MDPLYTLYKALTSGLFVAAFPPFWLFTRLTGRYRKGLEERLGLVPRGTFEHLRGSPRIWMHAVSLGEIRVASAIYRALTSIVPDCKVIISTTTEHGRELARETFQEVPVIYAPLDLSFCVKRALARTRPDVMVFLETEIWPAWLHEAKKTGARIAMINGRISPRSIKTYVKLRPFLRNILKKPDIFSMIRQEDARRILSMGADPDKIVVNGNAKYDALADQVDPDAAEDMRRSLDLDASQKILVAGSTRGGEEKLVLEVYETILKTFPDVLLFIAPRHIDRTPAIESLLKNRGHAYHLRSAMKERGEKRTASVVIMNTFGELFKLYALGTINFCGASLVPLGGQNALEPAAWGKAPFYGPFMEDFLDAKELLESVGGGIPVSSPNDFVEKALWFLTHPEELKDRGARAGDAVMQNRQSAEKHARVIAELL